MVNYVTIGTKVIERGLHKLEGIDSAKNFGCSGVLGDEVGNHGSDLGAIAKGIDLTHMSVIINKCDIIIMVHNRGSP